ncbi:MAG: hypothetical protein IJ856_03675 [Candidatus Methanomethylophilaceae archaeon]|nr:hypothetical protein [Candidatus Methanomethylophilaceae archaeon]
MNQTCRCLLLCIFVSLWMVVPLSDAYADEGDVRSIYDSLTESQKKGYDELDAAVKAHRITGSLDYLRISDGETVRDAYAYDHPEAFWFYDSYTLYIYTDEDRCSNIRYNPVYSDSQIAQMNKEIEKSLSSLKIDENDRDYKKLQTIHDWLCDRITYAKGSDHEGDIYGAIVEGRCVCQGYTMAFTYLCHLYGFDCVGVTGTTFESSVRHAWNLVYGEGDWYFVDVTWDDGGRYGSRTTYFMVGTNTMTKGGAFATQDHIADSLYGIIPSESRFVTPESRMAVVALVVIGLVVVAVMAYSRLRNRRHEIVLAPNTVQPYGICPYCGAALDDAYTFCVSCGANVSFDDENKEHT